MSDVFRWYINLSSNKKQQTGVSKKLFIVYALKARWNLVSTNRTPLPLPITSSLRTAQNPYLWRPYE